ncbi:SWI/SNF complex component SNF12 homolog [Prosopis cineraria]|uniref:SWI/SNF complex component SNF12 homolog n=1 Tax=Prosopis cineraria TaxID=364024 RepID=UPI00240EF7C6|nr:SWI/SNF complex component SNF12 homolog [Prosopis cineraria]
MNNPVKNVAASSLLSNSGIAPQPNTTGQPPHLLSQSKPQTQVASHFPGHFQLSEPQAQVFAHAQYPQPHVRVQSQAPHAQFQGHLQPQTQPVVAQLHSTNTNTANMTPPSVSTPVTASAKRATQKPPSRPSGSTIANASSPFKTMELTPAARRKKPKLPEKQIPEKVAALLPESALYTQLLEYEAQIDAILARKKIDVRESLKNPPCVQKTLRIYVYNTFSDQAQIDSETKNAEEPSWSLKITGRILEDGKDPVVAGISQKPGSMYPKFSSFFKKMTIYLDQSLYPDNHVILWESARSSIQQDGFEVKRKGDKEFTAVIRIELNYLPEKFSVSAQLSKLLGIEVETRPRIIAALWHYVKSRKLQSPNDPSFFMCDPPLQRVFGEEKIKFSMIAQKISQHLSQPQPIHLQHKIKLSGKSPAGTGCYDVQVDVPLPLQKDMSSFLASIERHKEIDACDEVISTAIKKIHEHRKRRAFFLGFSHSPAEFINALIGSQSKDLKLVAGDASHNAERERHAEFYNQSWVEDAVTRYLNRKTAESNAPGST